MKFILSILLLCFFEDIQAQKIITINNNASKKTIDNKIIDAHDGRIIQFGNKFYWYGTQYGNTNGFTNANSYVCYSSDNLMDWKLENTLFATKNEGVFYRPHVVYNKKNKKYILWYNWYPKLWDGQFGVAESDAPAGPFKVINDNVKVKNSNLGVGDLSIFVDDDAKAYLSYCTIQNHKVSVELLNENYTESTKQGSAFVAENCEAGSMFKRNGLYYLLTDYTCCFCTQGSGAQVFTATNPLGPYTYSNNINRYNGEAQPQLKDGEVHNNATTTLIAKNNDALFIECNAATKIKTFTVTQFTGNRNGQCGEVNNPILHQPILNYNFLVEIYKDGEWKKINSKSTFTNSSMQINYSIQLNEMVDAIKLTPIYKDTNDILQLEEITIPNAKYSVFKTAWGKPIIPAQQTHIMELNTNKGKQYVWMGDLWGSASNNVKGEDYQYWSAPLQFYNNGKIKQLHWDDKWSVIVK